MGTGPSGTLRGKSNEFTDAVMMVVVFFLSSTGDPLVRALTAVHRLVCNRATPFYGAKLVLGRRARELFKLSPEGD